MLVYSELEKAALQNVSATQGQEKAGTIYFNTTSGKPELDDGTDVTELVMRKHIEQTLKDDQVITVTNIDTFANLDALPRKEGCMYWASDLKRLYNDNGTALEEVGSANGVSGINYIENIAPVTGLDGWNLYGDAASTTPEDGTGGAYNLALTAETVTALRKASFKLSKDAANRMGQGLSTDFTIDRADQDKTLTIKFDAETSANYQDGDLEVYVYDVTNAQLITLTSGKNLKAGSNEYVGTFTSNANSLNYRLIFHVASANTLVWDVLLENVTVGPEREIVYPAITNWEDVSISLSAASWTSNHSVIAKRRRIGDTVKYNVQINIEGTVSGTLIVETPEELDFSKRVTFTSYGPFGNAIIYDAGTGSNRQLGTITYGSGGWLIRPNFSGSAVNGSHPFTFSNSDRIVMEWEFPVLGWDETYSIPVNDESNYSLTEIDTGRKWHDGRNVYRSTFDWSGSSSSDIPLGTLQTGLEVINYSGTAKRDSGQWFNLNYTASGTSGNQISISYNDTSGVVNLSLDGWVVEKTFVTLDYVK